MTDTIKYPTNLTPEELNIDITEGPDFDSIHDPTEIGSKLFKVPQPILDEIDRYLDERILNQADIKEMGGSNFFQSISGIYKFFIKHYFSLRYVLEYNTETIIGDSVRNMPAKAKDIISNNGQFLLLFLQPEMITLLFVFFAIKTILEFTFVPNTQNFSYEDIPRSIWYIPVFVTRFLGNLGFFLFYIGILLWTGLRRLLNPNVSLPVTISYMAFMIIAIQILMLSYSTAKSGEFPEKGVEGSTSVLLTYIIPLIIYAILPSFSNLIPYEFIKKHKQVPILPAYSSGENIQYKMAFDTIGCLTSGPFYTYSLIYALLYMGIAILFSPLDATISSFIRPDLLKAMKKNVTNKESYKNINFEALNPDGFKKYGMAFIYHITTILIICISSISIFSLPAPYNNGNAVFNTALPFAILLPIGKMLFDIKYNYKTMEFFSQFWDIIITPIRILVPLAGIVYFNQIGEILSYIANFDVDIPVPQWMLFGIFALFAIFLIGSLQFILPKNKSLEEQLDELDEEELNEDEDIEEEFSQPNLKELLQKAKTLLQSFETSH